jgi:hypothetical protein
MLGSFTGLQDETGQIKRCSVTVIELYEFIGTIIAGAGWVG